MELFRWFFYLLALYWLVKWIANLLFPGPRLGDPVPGPMERLRMAIGRFKEQIVPPRKRAKRHSNE